MSKLQVGIVLAFMLASFGLGYGYRNSQKATESVVVDEVKTRDNHTVVTTVTSKQPNGDIKVTKTIDSDTKTNVKENKQVVETKQPAAKTINISALAGLDFSKPLALTPIYGISVSKQVLGPIAIGAFGLTNGVVGLSLGVTF